MERMTDGRSSSGRKSTSAVLVLLLCHRACVRGREAVRVIETREVAQTNEEQETPCLIDAGVECWMGSETSDKTHLAELVMSAAGSDETRRDETGNSRRIHNARECQRESDNENLTL